VYFHRDSDGNIFYVGKGTERRAWSLDRHAAWKKYVSERLSGKYTVEIHKDGLTEAQAETLEDALISQYGKQLINWINYGRDFDYEALRRYHELRDANRRFIADTRPIELSNPPLAVERYRQAIATLREYESLTLERGIVAEMGIGPNWGDPSILDRLTLCLVKLGRFGEAITEAENYFSEFPSALQLALGKRINARIDKLRRMSVNANGT
jgi:hypothetical protein